MASRLGSGYYVVLVPEVSYGTKVTDLLATGTAMFDVVCELKNEPMVTDTKIKTGSVVPKIGEKVITANNATMTLSGNLCTEYAILLKALTHDTSSAYTLQEASTAPISYTVYQMFGVGNTEATTPYNFATGMVMTDFSITGEANGIVQFESTWRGQDVTYGVTTAITNEPTAWAVGTPFLFGDVTATLFNTKTTMNSFALKISKTLADDRFSYQNAMSRVAEYLTSYTGTLDVETIYDDTVDPTYIANISVQTALTNLITLVKSAVSWAITIGCNVVSATLADPDKGLFVSQYSLNMVQDTDGSPAALSITVA